MTKGPIGMTPTPWKVHRCKRHEETSVFRNGRTVTFDTGQGAAAVCHTDYYTPQIAEANAAYIVLAVNSHADMRTALETIRDIIGRCDADDTEAIREAAWRAHIIARAALNEISAANPEKAG